MNWDTEIAIALLASVVIFTAYAFYRIIKGDWK